MPASNEVKLDFLSKNISRAKNRRDGKIITLTPVEAFEIGVKQKWRCAGTQME